MVYVATPFSGNGHGGSMDRAEHLGIGSFVGALAVLVAAHRQGRPARFGEVVGGALWGAAGARLPDVLEPADHPNHRAVGHSVLTLGVTAVAAFKMAPELEPLPTQDTEQAQLVRDILQTAKLGLPAGYASHLVADATTPRGLPLHGLR
jgi:inner membrane protein